MPGSTVQINCVAGSLLSGFGSGTDVGPGAGVVPGEGAGTGDCSGATGGVVTGGDTNSGSGEDEGTAVGVEGREGAEPDGAGVQPAASSTSNTKKPTITFILMPTVQNQGRRRETKRAVSGLEKVF